MSSALLFTYGFVALMTAINGLRKPSPPTSRFPPLWLPAMLVGEAPWSYLAGRMVIAGTLVALGGTTLAMGRSGLLMVGAAQVMQLESARRSQVGAKRIGLRPVAAPFWQRLTSWPFKIPPGVERIEGLEYLPELTMDLYRSDVDRPPAPALIYVHGGSWGGGDPRRQFRTVTHHLASQGWIVLTIRYPLSPAATFPDHLVGVNRAIHWARTTGQEFGIDPGRLTIAGGSAGAHLAALAALTNGKYQPGFEDADTSVAAAVVLYGIYDFFNRNRTRFDWPLIPNRVMKATSEQAPDRFREASPIDQVNADAPPFLVVHGTHDSLVPPDESRYFAQALAAAGADVELLEVHGAQHAFDALGGIRTRALAARIEQFLDQTLSRRHHPPPEGIIDA
ncbi:MAG: alpha/beta hydrolase [Acidimicrobiia bacterium]|nr:alpha/beta hydrolase [Acidimicrobiia bacterium]